MILLSGMGADERLFRNQAAAFPQLIVPRWVDPHPHESLPSYARRLALAVDPGVPCFVGGASFGGLVALEMARHLDVIACFLIASIRSTDELPWILRAMRPLARLSPHHAESALGVLPPLMKPSMPRRLQNRMARYASPDAAFLRWASIAVLSHGRSSKVSFPVYSIHGQKDKTLPVGCTRPDVIVPGGDHLLPFTFPDQVNDFLRLHIQRHAA